MADYLEGMVPRLTCTDRATGKLQDDGDDWLGGGTGRPIRRCWGYRRRPEVEVVFDANIVVSGRREGEERGGGLRRGG